MLFSNNLIIEYGKKYHTGFSIQHTFPISYTTIGIVNALTSYGGAEGAHISTTLYPNNTTLEYFCISVRGTSGGSIDVPFHWISVGY